MHESRQVAHERAHDVDVLRHDLLHVRALHLDGYVGAARQARAVHLCDRGAAERRVVDGVEQLVEPGAVLALERGEHGLVGHGVNVAAQARQLDAEAFGQDLRAHREDLPGLDEGGAKLLEHAPELDRRDAAHHVVAAHDPKDLQQAGVAAPSAHAVAPGARAPEGAKDPDRLVVV